MNKMILTVALPVGLWVGAAHSATSNDDAFFDYLNNVVCDNPQGTLVATCAAASETVGGSGQTLSQTGNTGTLGANELAAREKLKLPAAEAEEESAGARLELSGWGLFTGIDYRNLQRDDTTMETGYDGSSLQLTLGADYRFSPRLLLGGVVSLQDADLDMNADAGSVNTESQEWVAFANYQVVDGLSVDAYVGTLLQQNDTDRNVSFGLIQNTAKASFDSEKLQWGLGSNYQLAFNALALDMGLRYEVSKLTIDAYEERGGDPILNLNLSYEEQTVDSETLTATLLASYNIGLDRGVLIPFVKLEATNEMKDSARGVRTHLVEAPDEPAFVITTDAPDDTYGVVGAGVQMILPGGLMVYVDAESLVAHDYLNTWKLSSGIRIEL